MKKIKILIASFLVLGFLGCDQDDTINTVYDGSIVGVGFITQTSSVIVPEEGVTSTVIVSSTVKTSAARTFNVSVDADASDGSAADYTIGTLTIPADSYEGSLDVTFGNFDNLQDLTAFTLVLKLDLPDNVSVVGSESTSFNYLKKIICNDMVLTINEDNYADERNWEITDSNGDIVLQCSDYADCPGGQPSGSVAPAQYVYNFNLDNGVYTFTIYDSFGDGLFDGSITGDYTLNCSLIIHATGIGNWGASQSTEFYVNQ